MHPRVLCAWLPNWPYQRMLKHEPKLIGQPFVLQSRDPRRGLIVAVTSPLARGLGIHPAMSISEANSTYPSLLALEHDPHEDVEALGWLAEAAQRFSPIVGFESLEKHLWAGRSLIQPQALLLDATGLTSFFGDEASMASAVQDWLRQQGYVSCIAIADSVGAAWAIANYRWRREVLGHLETQHQGQTWNGPNPWVGHGEAMRTSLAPLPVEALRLDEDTVRSLKRLGLSNLHHLMQLPRQGLASRLGTSLVKRIDQAWMGVNEPIASWDIAPEFQIEFSFEHPTDRRDTVEAVLKRLVPELCQRLITHGQGALRLLCRFDITTQGDKLTAQTDKASSDNIRSAVVLQLGLFRATADTDHLVPLLIGQCERQWERRMEVHRITLQASLTAELTWQQPELFEVEQVRHRDAAARLIDGLSSRLGRRSVVAPQMHRDPQPELACSWRPLTGRRADGRPQETRRKLQRASSLGPQVSDPLRRPLALLQPPVPLQVTSVHPDGPPIQFYWANHLHRVVRYWGAERIESGWWRGPSHRRDYFRVETEEGNWLWLFRQLQDGCWFLHGTFD